MFFISNVLSLSFLEFAKEALEIARHQEKTKQIELQTKARVLQDTFTILLYGSISETIPHNSVEWSTCSLIVN